MRHRISPFGLITLLTESGFASIIFGYSVFPAVAEKDRSGIRREPLLKEDYLLGPHCCSDPLSRPSALACLNYQS